MDSRRKHMQPGPIDGSVLTLQAQHRSEAVWNDIDGAATTTIDCRRHSSTRVDDLNDMHPRVVELIKQAGFYGLARIGFFPIDHHLVTALVERWRPETHTFHLPEGECTITLQDVAIQTGLRIDGDPVVSSTTYQWTSLCEQLLGRTPPTNAIRGSYIKVSWIVNEIPMPSDDASEQEILFFTRAYILRLLSGYIFQITSSGRLSLQFLPYLSDLNQTAKYSWGSACLAWLFRELCTACRYPLVRTMSGPLFLLQAWAYDRFPFIAPSISDIDVPHDAPLAARWHQQRNVTQVPTHVLVHIRHAFDTARQDDIIWEPYTAWILQNLPQYCLRGQHIWTTLVPLICIHIIEWHPTDRVMRQFGYKQHIPHAPINLENLHKLDLRTNQNWTEYHAHWLEMWRQREHWVQHGPTNTPTLNYHTQYMEWYRRITRRWIGVEGAAIGTTGDVVERITMTNKIEEAHNMAFVSQKASGEERRRAPIPAQEDQHACSDRYPLAPTPHVQPNRRRKHK